MNVLNLEAALIHAAVTQQIFCTCGQCLDVDSAVVLDMSVNGDSASRAYCSEACQHLVMLVRQVPMVRETGRKVVANVFTPHGTESI